MRKSLFLYLFILSVLCLVFTYSFLSKQVTFEQDRYKTMEKKLRDSLNLATSNAADANYFSLAKNQNAQDYFVNDLSEKPIDYNELIPKVTDALMALNDKPEGNPYTGQEKMGDQKFSINKSQILNHRWIIAEFSNGDYWGEVLLKYFVNEDGSISFEIIQSLIYQK